MKILAVSQNYYPEAFRINDVCAELVKRGHEVTVLTGIPNYPGGRYYKGYGVFKNRAEEHDGVRIVRAFVVPRGRNRLTLALNYMSFIVFGGRRGVKWARRNDFDVVFIYELSPATMALPGIKAAKKKGVPVAMFVGDLWPDNVRAVGGVKNGFLLSRLGRLVDKIYRSCDVILPSSGSFIDEIAKRGHPRDKILFLPQYAEDVYQKVDLEPGDPIHKALPEGFKFIFTGNIGFAQGLETLVAAAAILAVSHPDIKWVIVGDGRARESIERLVKKRGLASVIFLGRRPVGEIPKYLSACDVTLLTLKPDPVLSLYLPAKLQSYFKCGMPVLASAGGEAADVVAASGAGLSAEAGDPEALAAAALKFYNMPRRQREEMGKKAIEYYNANYQKEMIIKKLENCLKDLTDRQKSG